MKNPGLNRPICEQCFLPLGPQSHPHLPVSLTFILSRAVPFWQSSDDVLLLCQLCPPSWPLHRELVWASGTFYSAEAATCVSVAVTTRHHASRSLQSWVDVDDGSWADSVQWVGSTCLPPASTPIGWAAFRFGWRLALGSPFLKWQG
jgi:hypothetical protein